MATYTWTKEVCDKCGFLTRTRGKHTSDNLSCFNCKSGRMRWTEIHYGREKYAGENAGKTIKRARLDADKTARPMTQIVSVFATGEESGAGAHRGSIRGPGLETSYKLVETEQKG